MNEAQVKGINDRRVSVRTCTTLGALRMGGVGALYSQYQMGLGV